MEVTAGVSLVNSSCPTRFVGFSRGDWAEGACSSVQDAAAGSLRENCPQSLKGLNGSPFDCRRLLGRPRQENHKVKVSLVF